MENCSSTQAESTPTVNELKEVFFSYKINKSSGYDNSSFNVVRNWFGPLLKPLIAIFNLSFQNVVFRKNLKFLELHEYI